MVTVFHRRRGKAACCRSCNPPAGSPKGERRWPACQTRGCGPCEDAIDAAIDVGVDAGIDAGVDAAIAVGVDADLIDAAIDVGVDADLIDQGPDTRCAPATAAVHSALLGRGVSSWLDATTTFGLQSH